MFSFQFLLVQTDTKQTLSKPTAPSKVKSSNTEFGQKESLDNNPWIFFLQNAEMQECQVVEMPEDEIEVSDRNKM